MSGCFTDADCASNRGDAPTFLCLAITVADAGQEDAGQEDAAIQAIVAGILVALRLRRDKRIRGAKKGRS